MKRSRFYGVFNYKGESYAMWTHAKCREGAYMNFIAQLSKKVAKTRREMLCEFDGSIDNYFIRRKS